jgi:hypothetical protein
MAIVRPTINEPADAAMPGTRTRLAASGFFPVGASGMNFAATPITINSGQQIVSPNQLDIRGFSSFTIIGGALTNALDVFFDLYSTRDAATPFGTIQLGTFAVESGTYQTTVQKAGVVWSIVTLRIRNNTGGNGSLNHLEELFCSA